MRRRVRRGKTGPLCLRGAPLQLAEKVTQSARVRRHSARMPPATLEHVRQRSWRANIRVRCPATPARGFRSSKRGARRGFARQYSGAHALGSSFSCEIAWPRVAPTLASIVSPLSEDIADLSGNTPRFLGPRALGHVARDPVVFHDTTVAAITTRRSRPK